MPNTSPIHNDRAFFMARRPVRTPGATEEQVAEVQATEATPEPTTEVIEPVATEQADLLADPATEEQVAEPMPEPKLGESLEPPVGMIIPCEDFTPDWVVKMLESNKRIEDKLDALLEQSGVKVKNKKRLKFVEGQGYVRE